MTHASPSVLCARCGAAMLHLQLGAGRGYACNGCGAVFLARTHATRVRQGLDRVAPWLAERGAAHLPSVAPELDALPLACPICRRQMAAEWIAQRSFRIDHCMDHGTFFDAHELAELAPARGPNPHPEKPRLEVDGFGDAALEVVATLLLGGD